MHSASDEPREPLDSGVRRVIESLKTSGVIASHEHHASLASTNSTALEWLNRHRAAASVSVQPDEIANHVATIRSELPRLVFTDAQTAGRGRLGRSWQAQQDGLAFSLVLDGCNELLSIAVGVAIAEAIEHIAAPLHCGLKWPNDVWISGKKVAGTLIERVDFPFSSGFGLVDNPLVAVVIGIGMNVGSSPTICDVETTSVCEGTGKWITRPAMLSELVVSVIENVQRLQSDSDECLHAFRARCVLTGETIRCSIDGVEVMGRCEGINAQGEMQVQTPTGVRVCRSGEVSRVRMV